MLDPIGKTHGIDPKRRRDIRILYGEPQPGLGKLQRSCLKREGFSDVLGFNALPPLVRALAEYEPDLLILDAEMPGGDSVALVRDIREGRTGRNPFLATIVTAWGPSLALTALVSESGADDLLAKPVSLEQIVERISVLVYQRKPYIVTGDYIGPERHPDDEPGVTRLAIPNTLKTKISGASSGSAMTEDEFDGALRAINEQRLRCHGGAIARLVAEILPPYRNRCATAATCAALERLLLRADDAQGRLTGTAYVPVSDLCVTLRKVARAILRDHPTPTEKDLNILPRLADAILVGFGGAREAAAIGGEIANSVGRYLDVRGAQRL